MEAIKVTQVYCKPLFEKQNISFIKEILEQFNNGETCVQCSRCHGCR